MVLSQLSRSASRFPKKLVISYLLDWVVMVVLLALAIGFHNIDGTSSRHAFSLQDPSISYPHTDDTISNPVLYVASLVVPGILIAIICLSLTPRPSSSPALTTSQLWQRRIWEWNAAWLGLALSCLSAIAITNGLKPLAGKPRPHLLAACDPDLSPESIAQWQVGGLGTSIDSATPIVVTWQICRNSDLKNAFSSFPSGHAATSWSGLLYLSLFFCAKFGVKIPFLRSPWNQERRTQGAAPPSYLVLIGFVPVGAALYISTTRWFDYRHHGFDIIAGDVLGIFCAWVSFHLYQVPISSGDGWAWAPRSRRYAFGLRIGSSSYADHDTDHQESRAFSPKRNGGPSRDVEDGGHRDPHFEMQDRVMAPFAGYHDARGSETGSVR
jgi:membrane-associated phospholipid phosphatase